MVYYSRDMETPVHQRMGKENVKKRRNVPEPLKEGNLASCNMDESERHGAK